MKLTIEHLAAYLPYELQILRPDGKTQLTMVGIDENHYVFKGTMYGSISSPLNKLLLRPLSDLTNPIEHNGETFVPINYFIGEDCDNILNAAQIKDFCSVEYSLVTKLLSWHFDIFSLIPQGLALPIKPQDNEQ